MPLPHRLQEAAHELHRRPAGGNEAEDKLGQFVSRLITMTTLQTPVTLKRAAFRWEREQCLLQTEAGSAAGPLIPPAAGVSQEGGVRGPHT